MTALAPPKLLEKLSELLAQHGHLNDRGAASAHLPEAVLPQLDEQEQISFHGVLRRLDTLADALLAEVGITCSSPLRRKLFYAPAISRQQVLKDLVRCFERVILSDSSLYIEHLTAPQGNSRVLVDAEHTYMQPAIDALTIRLQQRCNRDDPIVINTYQVCKSVSHIDAHHVDVPAG